jgi:hypothetical protein
MRKQVAVAIGVRRAGGLADLPGAVNGAKEFHEWAGRQHYETHLVTDEGGPVAVQTLKSLIKAIVDAGDVERLLIYFAGHGIQPSVNTTFWLLSRWEEDSDEAVNVNLSFANAKRSGIGQIAVFSDACRSTVKDAAYVGGGSIFPKPPNSVLKLPQWDHFLASRLGEIAQEVPGADTTKAYGIFTRCVMQALSGAAEKAIESRPGQQPPRAVTSSHLATFLEDVVPLESGKTPGAQVQFPEVSSGWRNPKDVYIGFDRDPADIPSPEFKGPLLEFRINRRFKPSAAREAVERAEQNIDAEKNKAEALFAASRGRESFETRQGLTIIGAKPINVVSRNDGQTDLFWENNAPHVRGHGGGPQTVMIELENKNWISACIIPEFVGTVVVVDGVAASVNYLPAGHFPFGREVFDEIAPIVNRWMALMNQGRVGSYAELKQAAEKLRQHKHYNPSLGILAAYAYERAGDIPEIDSIVEYFFGMGQFIPFDIAVLSTKPVARIHEDFIIPWGNGSPARVAGSFPLMTQGWSFLDPEDGLISRELFELRRGLLPSLWTTFRETEGIRVAGLLRERNP